MVHSTNAHPNEVSRKPKIWMRRFLISEAAELKLLGSQATPERAACGVKCASVFVSSSATCVDGNLEMFTVNPATCAAHIESTAPPLPFSGFINNRSISQSEKSKNRVQKRAEVTTTDNNASVQSAFSTLHFICICSASSLNLFRCKFADYRFQVNNYIMEDKRIHV